MGSPIDAGRLVGDLVLVGHQLGRSWEPGEPMFGDAGPPPPPCGSFGGLVLEGHRHGCSWEPGGPTFGDAARGDQSL